MNIAYTIGSKPGDTDLLLARFATYAAESGLRTCGTVQVNTDREDCARCDMDVRILPNGPVIRISQSLGKEAKGCRLDSEALETAVGIATERLQSGGDILVINKFGKHEASGRGFREIIAEALSRDIPVLVGTNGLNEAALVEFTGGEASFVEPTLASLKAWHQSILAPQPV